jgi:hypothetical protein
MGSTSMIRTGSPMFMSATSSCSANTFADPPWANLETVLKVPSRVLADAAQRDERLERVLCALL